MLVIINPDGEFVYTNSTFQAHFGSSEKFLPHGVFLKDILEPTNATKTFRKAIRSLKLFEFWNGFVSCVDRDGQILNLSVDVKRNDDGTYLCTAHKANLDDRDSSFQKKIIKRINSETEMAKIRKTTENVSHDLSSLVVSVRSCVALLERSERGGENFSYALDVISIAMDTAEDLIRSMDSINHKNCQQTTLNLCDVISDTVLLLGPERIKRNKVEKFFPCTQPIVQANRVELVQLLFNLMVNACQSDNDGAVEVRVAPVQERPPQCSPDIGSFDLRSTYALISIKDHGSGVDPSVCKNIFKRNVSTKALKSRGLGLHIAKEIIENNNGAIWFQSKIGAGTTVHVAWPINSDAHPTLS